MHGAFSDLISPLLPDTDSGSAGVVSLGLIAVSAGAIDVDEWDALVKCGFTAHHLDVD